MFIDDINEIKAIASKVGTSIFVIPHGSGFAIKNALMLEPEQKSVITIEQVREIIKKVNTKQSFDQYVIIHPAETLGLDAANALLKSLEEPGSKVHFVLITESISNILPTILSRASIYYLRTDYNDKICASDEIIKLAKKLIASKPSGLVEIANEITKKKDGVREYSKKVVSTAIEILYKSYYITGKMAFLQRLPKFLKLYDNLNKNGHIKLHIIADLI